MPLDTLASSCRAVARAPLQSPLEYLVADCRTVAEVAELVDLATLVPEQRSN